MQESKGEAGKLPWDIFYTVVTLHWRELLLNGLSNHEAFFILSFMTSACRLALLSCSLSVKLPVIRTERKCTQMSSGDIPGLKLTNKWTFESRPNILIDKQDTFYVRRMCTKMFFFLKIHC